MERYFDAHWPEGRTMMCNTASIQVNLDIGRDEQIETRWRLAHDLGPVLAAAFANSPLDAYGNPTGWRSTRLAVWHAIDPARTNSAFRAETDARTSWSQYTMDAPVMLIRADPNTSTPLEHPFTFGEWMSNGHELGWPTIDDFDYHLTTLFPPIRPRGWLELRMIDALPDAWWPVAVAVAATLLDDAEASARATEATAHTRGCWIAAAHDGLSDPVLRDAADRCFTAVLDALPRLGTDAPTIASVAAFHDRYVVRGRSPADDLIGEWAEFRAATV
jgi:glutamate--cysteine ligase